MAQAPKHRQAIIEAAVRLFRRQGYAASGLNQIVEASGAPKGSMYHYFPEGKTAIAAEAVRHAARRVERTLAELAAQGGSAGDLLRRYASLLAGWMAESDFRDGCPIATTLLETAPQVEPIREAGEQAFDAWARVLAERLAAQGLPPDRARRLSRTAIAALEGALLMSRVQASGQPLIDMAEEIAIAFDAAIDRQREDPR
ncbi:MAG: TetR family transcriptional regulator [Burkholderiaceae bacterium]